MTFFNFQGYSKITDVVGPHNQIDSVISDYLMVVSILIGIGSFLMDYYIQRITKLSIRKPTKFLKRLIISLLVPSILIIIFGVIMGFFRIRSLLTCSIFFTLLIPIIVDISNQRTINTQCQIALGKEQILLLHDY